MISDVLSDGISAIEEYQVLCPEWYGDIAAEIEVVKTVMDALREYLDTSFPTGNPIFDKWRKDLLAAIRGLDTSTITAVYDRSKSEPTDSPEQAAAAN